MENKCFEKLYNMVKGIADSDERAKIANNFFDKNPYCEGEYTLEQVGKILGVTRERARQIEMNAIKKLRNPKIGRKLKELLSL